MAEGEGESTVKKSQINALMKRARRACSRGYSIISGRVSRRFRAVFINGVGGATCTRPERATRDAGCAHVRPRAYVGRRSANK